MASNSSTRKRRVSNTRCADTTELKRVASSCSGRTSRSLAKVQRGFGAAGQLARQRRAQLQRRQHGVGASRAAAAAALPGAAAGTTASAAPAAARGASGRAAAWRCGCRPRHRPRHGGSWSAAQSCRPAVRAGCPGPRPRRSPTAGGSGRAGAHGCARPGCRTGASRPAWAARCGARGIRGRSSGRPPSTGGPGPAARAAACCGRSAARPAGFRCAPGCS